MLVHGATVFERPVFSLVSMLSLSSGIKWEKYGDSHVDVLLAIGCSKHVIVKWTGPKLNVLSQPITADLARGPAQRDRLKSLA